MCIQCAEIEEQKESLKKLIQISSKDVTLSLKYSYLCCCREKQEQSCEGTLVYTTSLTLTLLLYK